MSANRKPRIQVLPLKSKAPFEAPSVMDVLVRLTAPERHAPTARPPLNLGLVLDRSGSMSGAKLRRAREAATFAVDQLLPDDRVSVTVFDDEVDVIVPAGPTGQAEDRARIKASIEKVRAGGSTALYAAWAEGGRQVARAAAAGYLSRVLLITDGLANVGETDPEVIVSGTRGLYGRGISTSTIGVGDDFNEDLLVAMAAKAGGNSWFVEGPEDFRRIFETELDGLMREVCTGVTLTVDLPEGIELVDVLNDFERIPGGGWMLPSLLAGEPLDLVLRLGLPGGTPGRFHCLKAVLAWSELGAEGRFAAEVPVSVEFVAQAEADLEQPNPEVVRAVQLLEAARTKRQAMRFMDEGDFRAATRILRGQSRHLADLSADYADAAIAEEVQSLSRLSEDLEQRRNLARTRKTMTYQSTQRQRGRREKGR